MLSKVTFWKRFGFIWLSMLWMKVLQKEFVSVGTLLGRSKSFAIWETFGVCGLNDFFRYILCLIGCFASKDELHTRAYNAQ